MLHNINIILFQAIQSLAIMAVITLLIICDMINI